MQSECPDLRDSGIERLYDSSAILNMMLKGGPGSLDALSGQAVLDLTIYETGDLIWRLWHLQKRITREEACRLLDAHARITASMKVLGVIGREHDVMDMAADTGQSFYGSAYMVLAKEGNLVLVTDDKRLQRAASACGINTAKSDGHGPSKAR